MRLGIVGSEAAKFTPKTEEIARRIIYDLITDYAADEVVSGGCHLGGIDVWAAEEGKRFGLHVVEFFPKTLNWSTGYKPRNLAIAKYSDVVFCITVKELPLDYKGMRFKMCYHCDTDTHVKSGGCWTVKQAIKMGKHGDILVCC